jgi:hypothetical protein
MISNLKHQLHLYETRFSTLKEQRTTDNLPAKTTSESGPPKTLIFDKTPISSNIHLPPKQTFNPFTDLFDDFLSEDRSPADLEFNCLQVISKDERIRLTPSDKSKLFFDFSKGITNKFKGMNTIVGLDNVATINNVATFSQQRIDLQKHITGIAAHTVFLVLKFDEDNHLIDPQSPKGSPLNILSTSVMPSLAEVERSTAYYYRRGSKYHQENLTWSYEAIRNSCDKDLQSILDAKMLKYNDPERFGPLYYYQLVQHMTTVDSKAIRAITQELTNLKMPDQEGESIAKVCKLIRSTILWLSIVQMVPPDIYAIVYDILETCTVPDFSLFLKTYATNATLNGIQPSVEELLIKAEEHYRTLILSKRWNVSSSIGSSFQTQRSSRITTGSQTGSEHHPLQMNHMSEHTTGTSSNGVTLVADGFMGIKLTLHLSTFRVSE